MTSLSELFENKIFIMDIGVTQSVTLNGETVEVVGDASQEWVQIRCTEQDGKEGYVKSEFLTAAE